MHFYVVGVNGSGKTSLLRAIAETTGIANVHGTAELMKYLGIPGDYDALRAMDQDEVLVKWGETAGKLLQEYGKKPFLLDTHILNLTNGKITRRDGPWIQKYDVLVLVKADPATILDRVTKDRKDRALFPAGMSHDQRLTMLKNYQLETEQLFNQLAEQYNIPTLVIENDQPFEVGIATFKAFGVES